MKERELFVCDQYGCRMTRAACGWRQYRARHEAYTSEMTRSLEPCINCEQGKTNAGYGARIGEGVQPWRGSIRAVRIGRQLMADLMAMGLA